MHCGQVSRIISSEWKLYKESWFQVLFLVASGFNFFLKLKNDYNSLNSAVMKTVLPRCNLFNIQFAMIATSNQWQCHKINNSEKIENICFYSILSRAVTKFSWSLLIRSYQDLFKIYHENLAFQALGKIFQVSQEM